MLVPVIRVTWVGIPLRIPKAGDWVNPGYLTLYQILPCSWAMSAVRQSPPAWRQGQKAASSDVVAII